MAGFFSAYARVCATIFIKRYVVSIIHYNRLDVKLRGSKINVK